MTKTHSILVSYIQNISSKEILFGWRVKGIKEGLPDLVNIKRKQHFNVQCSSWWPYCG